MNLYERIVLSRRKIMNCISDKLLANTAFAGNQNACLAVCHLSHHFFYFLYFRRFAYHSAEHCVSFKLRLQLLVLKAELTCLQCTLYNHSELVKIERLCKEVICSVTHCFNRTVYASMSGENDDGNSWGLRRNFLKHFFAAYSRHPQVCYNKIDITFSNK